MEFLYGTQKSKFLMNLQLGLHKNGATLLIYMQNVMLGPTSD